MFASVSYTLAGILATEPAACACAPGPASCAPKVTARPAPATAATTAPRRPALEVVDVVVDIVGVVPLLMGRLSVATASLGTSAEKGSVPYRYRRCRRYACGTETFVILLLVSGSSVDVSAVGRRVDSSGSVVASSG
ncbi:Uncharacterised protein [Mycobacteroides abscessus subsp. abscessus]|nr:Uncharacterised protein [Mycobacteroides abscessus subsp. abscessus]